MGDEGNADFGVVDTRWSGGLVLWLLATVVAVVHLGWVATFECHSYLGQPRTVLVFVSLGSAAVLASWGVFATLRGSRGFRIALAVISLPVFVFLIYALDVVLNILRCGFR
jgi:hypothetical protein